MRLTTIWTIPAMTFREWIARTADWTDMTIAARLPKRIKYWVFVLVGGKAIGNDVVPEAKYLELLDRIPGSPRT